MPTTIKPTPSQQPTWPSLARPRLTAIWTSLHLPLRISPTRINANRLNKGCMTCSMMHLRRPMRTPPTPLPTILPLQPPPFLLPPFLHPPFLGRLSLRPRFPLLRGYRMTRMTLSDPPRSPPPPHCLFPSPPHERKRWVRTSTSQRQRWM